MEIYSGSSDTIYLPHVRHPQKIFYDDSNNVIVAGDYTDSTNGSNFFAMRLKQKVGTGVVETKEDLPTTYSLSQNYPNPFNPTTTIRYSIPSAGVVQLKVYDILGSELSTLIDEYKQAGVYEVEFDAAKFTSGVYLYKLTSGEYSATKKMMVLK